MMKEKRHVIINGKKVINNTDLDNEEFLESMLKADDEIENLKTIQPDE